MSKGEEMKGLYEGETSIASSKLPEDSGSSEQASSHPRNYCPHFPDEEVEAQRIEGICQGSGCM